MILRSLKTALLGIVTTLVVTLLYAPGIIAANTGAIAQGFTASADKGDVVAGALVSLQSNGNGVELATTETADQLVGVVDKSPLLAISDSAQEAQVVLGGTVQTLVSDINGDIKAGDRITASPIAGVGMKATESARVIGVAQANFNTNNAQTQNITDSHGATHAVDIGGVPLQVGLANYQAPGSSFLPPFLQDIANNVAGKQVSIIRVLISAALLLVSFITLAIFTFSSARSAMISIGRNPLASAHIRSSLYQVGIITVTTLGATLLACYFILKF